MSKLKIIEVESAAYFSTYKIYNGRKLLVEEPYLGIVLNSLKWLRDEGRMYLLAFVVMPNHIHFIFKPRDKNTPSKIAHSFGSFTAHDIAKKCEMGNPTWFNEFKLAALKEKDRDTVIWGDVFVKTITKEKFLFEKIEYIHNNPVNKGWHLVDERGDYRYSSACFYDYGRQPIIEIDSLEEIKWE